MLLVDPSGQTEGTIGGGCVEAEVRRRALALLQQRSSQLLSFLLDHDYGWDDGLICGGKLDAAVVSYSQPTQLEALREAIRRIQRQQGAQIVLRVEREGRWVQYRVRVEPTPTLLIAGAGHVGAALARLAVDLGFRTVVIDDRDDLLASARLPPPIETARGEIAEVLRGWPIDVNTYVVVVTRGHNHDEQALHAVIDSPAKYLGMIGSKRKIRLIFDDLVTLGVDPARLAQVHSPIGLPIQAASVPEIAVSIAAELIQIRRAEPQETVEGPLEELSGEPG